MATRTVKLTEASIAIAMEHGPSVSQGITELNNKLIEALAGMPIGMASPSAPASKQQQPEDSSSSIMQLSTIPMAPSLNTMELETMLRRILQEEGVMLHKKQKDFFQNLNKTLVQCMSDHNHI